MEWSTDDAHLITGSVDNSCIIWDVCKGSVHQILDGHLHYVQGVSWDPLGHYVASLSSDRTCRIYVNKPLTTSKDLKTSNYAAQHVITKAEQLISADSKILSTKIPLFHDETLPSFFRRLAWSPDGSFLVVPAGSYKFSSISDSVNTAYIFSRKDLSRPTLQLPASGKPVIAVRFCSIVFSLRAHNSDNEAGEFFKLPYRYVFAVDTLNSLYIYDAESVPPIAIFAGLHYAAITDISWSPDSKYLALSSQDGYCTLVEFDSDDLGSPFNISETVKAKNEIKNPVDQVPNEVINTIDVVEAESKADRNKKETEASEEKASPNPVIAPVSNKLAKRRITPMTIDP